MQGKTTDHSRLGPHLGDIGEPHGRSLWRVHDMHVSKEKPWGNVLGD